MERTIEYTVAQAKGRRLRMARALAGLSRQDLREKTGIATSTMDTWESGRVELNEKSSVRVSESLRKLGIFCSSEWLLYGKGMPPYMMTETEKSMFSTETKINIEPYDNSMRKTLALPPFLDADIKKELSFFLNLHGNSMFYIVKEKFLNSQYEIGDCVAGVAENPKKLIGKIVIIQDKDENFSLGRLIGVDDQTADVFLNSRNPSVKIEFQKIAYVIWHRKPGQ